MQDNGRGIIVQDIVKLMQNQPKLYVMEGASEEEIIQAETALGLRFAADYRKYTAAFGAASLAAHELTGVCKSNRLNVVDVTIKERSNTNVSDQWYVLEQTNIDGIVVWQSSTGEIYQVYPNGVIRKIAAALAEYLLLN